MRSPARQGIAEENGWCDELFWGGMGIRYVEKLVGAKKTFATFIANGDMTLTYLTVGASGSQTAVGVPALVLALHQLVICATNSNRRCWCGDSVVIMRALSDKSSDASQAAFEKAEKCLLQCTPIVTLVAKFIDSKNGISA